MKLMNSAVIGLFVQLDITNQYIFVIYHEVDGHVNTDHEHYDGDGGDGDDEGRPENFGESMNV